MKQEKPRKSNSTAAKDDRSTLKVKIRGKDNTPVTIQELAEGLLDLIRLLKKYEAGYRVRYPALYLTMIDEDGQPVRINDANELTLYPYRTAAEEHGL